MNKTANFFKSPPRTAMEVFEMLPEGTLAEVINNVIYMSPAPSFEHQDVSLELAASIRVYASSSNLGKCVVSPIDIYFDDKNVFQPDIIFISNENMDIVKEGKVRGAPDVIVEVLSPGNKKHDTERKKPVYEKFGVKEYFIIDPKTKEVFSYYLSGKQYVKQESSKGKIKSVVLKKTFGF